MFYSGLHQLFTKHWCISLIAGGLVSSGSQRGSWLSVWPNSPALQGLSGPFTSVPHENLGGSCSLCGLWNVWNQGAPLREADLLCLMLSCKESVSWVRHPSRGVVKRRTLPHHNLHFLFYLRTPFCWPAFMYVDIIIYELFPTAP